MKNSTAVERTSERELVVTRTFNAPAHIVFEAWTNPELFKRWRAPKSTGVSLLSCEQDVRGGSRRHGLLGRREDVACGRRTCYVLRTLDSEVHPSCIHGLIHFFGGSGATLRDAELLERVRPTCTRYCNGFHVEIQDLTQLFRDFIRGDHRTKLDDALS
jgi:hypothetical protein